MKEGGSKMKATEKPCLQINSMMQLPDGKHLGEVIMNGSIAELGGMLEQSMNQNRDLASMVLGAAIFFADSHGINLEEYAKMYRERFKDMK
jgi:hypothetical protein